jgi:hypothetical protein
MSAIGGWKIECSKSRELGTALDAEQRRDVLCYNLGVRKRFSFGGEIL